MTRKNLAALAGAIGMLLACGAAQAQLYHYKDADGHMVYSDNPPPPNIPAANILKAPKLKQSSPGATPAATATTDPKDGKKKGPQTTAEREADYKKRMADADKKSKEDAAKAADQATNQQRCQSLQSNLAALQGGQRLRKIDASGNPYYIDDDQRAADITKAQSDIASAKCSG